MEENDDCIIDQGSLAKRDNLFYVTTHETDCTPLNHVSFQFHLPFPTEMFFCSLRLMERHLPFSLVGRLDSLILLFHIFKNNRHTIVFIIFYIIMFYFYKIIWKRLGPL